MLTHLGIGTYPVWRLIKESAIANRRDNNAQKVHDFLTDVGFYKSHKHLRNHLYTSQAAAKRKYGGFKYSDTNTQAE